MARTILCHALFICFLSLAGESFSEKVLKWDKNLDFALLFGGTVSKTLTDNIVANLSPFVSYILDSVYSSQSQRPGNRQVPFTKVVPGIRIGIEYLFIKDE